MNCFVADRDGQTASSKAAGASNDARGACLRMVFVSQEYPPETARGGIGTQTYLKAQGLAARGHHVTVLSQSPDESRHEYRDGEVRVIRIPIFSSQAPMQTEAAQWLTYSAQVAAELGHLQHTEGLDLLDFPEWGSEGYVYLLNRTEETHVPAVIHLHGPLVMFAHTMGWPAFNSNFYAAGEHMERTCLRLADAVFSSSDCSARWCAAHYGLDANSIPRLHTGVDTELFHPDAAAKADRPTIVFVGKVVRNKGVKLLLQAACRLRSEFPGLRLAVIGRGEREVFAELRALAAQHGADQMLELPGFLHRAELPRQLAAAHVFAAPSVYEGGPGFVYLEAMACGLPVIACQGSGAGEVVRHEDTGLMVPPYDVEALVTVLRKLLSSAPLREALGARARKYAVAEADVRVCLDRLEAFYRRVVDAGGNQAIRPIAKTPHKATVAQPLGLER